jgi:hypothetical protein
MDQLGISLLPSDDELALKFEGRPRFEAAAYLKRELLAVQPLTNVTLDWERA